MREDAYSLDADELCSVVDDLARGHAVLGELALALEAHINELHLTWDGQAAEAHRLAQACWSRGFEDMRGALARMRQAADAAHRNYTSAAEVNLRMWEQVP